MKGGKKEEMKIKQIVKIITELKTLKCFGLRTTTVFCCLTIKVTNRIRNIIYLKI